MRAINIPLLIVSLLISITLWLVVFAKDIPIKAVPRLDIRYTHLDAANWWQDPTYLQPNTFIKFVGPAEEMDQLQNNPPTINVDLSANPKAGSHRYSASLSDPKFEQYLSEDEKALTVQVTLQRVVRRSVPVEVRLTGSPENPSLAIDTSHVSQKTVTVSGPAGYVNQVSKCVALFEQGGITPANHPAVEEQLSAYDRYGRPVEGGALTYDPISVIVTPVLIPARSDRRALVNPNIIGQLAPGYRQRSYETIPSTVRVSGDPTELQSVTSVDTDPVDINGLTRNRSFRVRLKAPAGLKVSPSVVTVREIVEPVPGYTPSPTESPSNPSETPSNSPSGETAGRGGA